ncbi:MAG TPA: hypothetical protein DEP05_05840 [Betaproteobacteria bacterium]|nr:hypothetical protein [Betaproteobacteria bacterium]
MQRRQTPSSTKKLAALGAVLAALLTAHTLAYAAASPGHMGFFDHRILVLAVLLGLLALSGVFSASEIALVSLSTARVRALVAADVLGSASIHQLKRAPNRMLITILLGNNLANIGASMIAAAWTEAAFGSTALGIAAAALTLFILIFGEIFPKTYAQQHAEGFSCLIARPLLILETAFFPLIWTLEWILHFSMKYTGGKRQPLIEPAAELQALAEELSEQGKIEDNLQNLISGTFAFGKKRALDIMTPVSRLTMIEAGRPLAELRQLFLDSGHSRIPVYANNRNRVIGIVNMHMLLQAEKEGKQHAMETHWTPPVAVSPDICLDDLLTRLQQERQQLAILVDRQQRLRGIVTVENVLEEIVGELFDEKDRDKVLVHRLGTNSWEVTGDCPIYEFRKYFRGFESGQPPFKSIAALLAERAPEGALTLRTLVMGTGYRMQIAEMRETSISLVRIVRISRAP